MSTFISDLELLWHRKWTRLIQIWSCLDINNKSVYVLTWSFPGIKSFNSPGARIYYVSWQKFREVRCTFRSDALNLSALRSSDRQSCLTVRRFWPSVISDRQSTHFWLMVISASITFFDRLPFLIVVHFCSSVVFDHRTFLTVGHFWASDI